ncbi:MAG: hypothetical protein JJU23_15515, partial [Cyclobacteriaceae bacterium]|nr:hypothetical protein [Cyclobacteriaceae bacterium]
YTSSGGAEYIFGNGEWTRQDGILSEVVVTAQKPSLFERGYDIGRIITATHFVSIDQLSSLFGYKENPSFDQKAGFPLTSKFGAGVNESEHTAQNMYEEINIDEFPFLGKGGSKGKNVATSIAESLSSVFSLSTEKKKSGYAKVTGDTIILRMTNETSLGVRAVIESKYGTGYGRRVRTATKEDEAKFEKIN